jgi:hypothetical protein
MTANDPQAGPQRTAMLLGADNRRVGQIAVYHVE